MFSLICVWINSWVNNRGAGNLWRHRAHYDVSVYFCCLQRKLQWLNWWHHTGLVHHSCFANIIIRDIAAKISARCPNGQLSCTSNPLHRNMSRWSALGNAKWTFRTMYHIWWRHGSVILIAVIWWKSLRFSRIMDKWSLFHPNLQVSRGPFYYHGLTLIPAWISNHIHYKRESNYLSIPKLQQRTVKVWNE